MATSRQLSIGAIALVALSLAGCSGSGASTAPTTVPSTAATAAASSAPASSDASSSGSSGATVEATSVGSLGTVLVAGSNGMTVYTFTKDTANSGTSACTGTCISTWPAVTISGGSPTAGGDVTGKLGTITRSDDGSTQVTYNGLPLYFYSGDSQPGDGNGVYTNWEAVKP